MSAGSRIIHRKRKYSGRVQGVGFRATTRRVASDFDIAGSVRNLLDGDVEVIAEGHDSEVLNFFTQLDEVMSRNIQSFEEVEEEIQNLKGFEILR